MARDHVTVGIVGGGGVAGLTLAKMLEMNGVSYILYESYHQIAPNAGASLGLMPNGVRIFDQLGLIEQIESVYSQITNANVMEGVQTSDVYKLREIAVMTALEEGVGEDWHSGRMFLLGDSAHKMVPHAAMGANQAMESAACFVNNLRRVNRGLFDEQNSHIPAFEVLQCLNSYAQKRRDYLRRVVEAASATCRNQLMIGSAAADFLHFLPELRDEDFLLKVLGSFTGAEKLDNWNCGSKRVDYYNEESRKAQNILANGGSLNDLGLATTERC